MTNDGLNDAIGSASIIAVREVELHAAQEGRRLTVENADLSIQLSSAVESLVTASKRVGETPHLNVELGRHGRFRSNVWNYDGVNTFGAGRIEELRLPSDREAGWTRC